MPRSEPIPPYPCIIPVLAVIERSALPSWAMHHQALLRESGLENLFFFFFYLKKLELGLSGPGSVSNHALEKHTNLSKKKKKAKQLHSPNPQGPRTHPTERRDPFLEYGMWDSVKRSQPNYPFPELSHHPPRRDLGIKGHVPIRCFLVSLSVWSLTT